MGLPNQLSHRGVVMELNSILGATRISLARFLVAPNIVWEPLYISQSPCVCLCGHLVQNFEKYRKIIMLQIYGKFVAQMIERVVLIQGSRVRASVSSFCFKSFFDFLELNMVILVLNVFLSTPPLAETLKKKKKKKKKKKS